MSLIDDIRRDADSGTKDYHWIGRTLMAKEFGEVVELFNADWSALDEFEAEHKRRIARVPDLERALLAAEEAMGALQEACTSLVIAADQARDAAKSDGRWTGVDEKLMRYAREGQSALKTYREATQ